MAAAPTNFFKPWITDYLNKNATLVDLSGDAIRIAMFTNSIGAQNFDTDVGWGAGPYAANEVYQVATNLPSGGATMTIGTVGVSSGTIYVAASNVVLGPGLTTPSAFRGGLVYSDTHTSNIGLLWFNWGADFSVTDPGTLTIDWQDTPVTGTVFSIAAA
jgi:hypothetical protein